MAKQPVTTVESVEETNTEQVPAEKLVLQVENLEEAINAVESVEETNTEQVPAEKLVLQVENLEEAINALEAFAFESVMASQILSKVEEVRNLSRVK